MGDQHMTEIRGLGYLEVQTTDIDRWRELTVDALGFAVGTGPNPDALYLRMDERRARRVIHPADTDRVRVVGWEVRDQFALAAVGRAVEAAGVGVKEGSAGQVPEGGVEAAVTFDAPAGTPVQVFFAPVLDHSPLIPSLAQQFVTGDQG